MSDSYGSLEWYRNLSEADKAYASTYGRDALIQKQKREAEAQQQQEQQQVEESEPEVEEQVEESEEESEPQPDPFLEQKANQLEQKQRILDELERQVSEQNEFSDYLAVPEWREVLRDYIGAVNFVIQGYANYFTEVITMNGEKLDFDFQFFDKNGKKIERVNPTVAVQPAEGE